MTQETYNALSTTPTYTTDKALETIGMGRFQYLLILLTGLCWTAESMEMLLLSFIKQPLQCAWGISDTQASLITTSVGLGMLLGSTLLGTLADRVGRRPVFILSTLLTSVLGLASAVAPNYWSLLLTRGGVGFGIGGIPVSYTLLTEFLPSAERGRWGICISLFWSLGAIFEALVALWVLPQWGWRWLIAASTTPLFVVLMLTFLVRESPRWLAASGRIEESERVIRVVAESNRTHVPDGALVASEDVKGGVRELLRPGARGLAGKIFVVWFACAFLYYGLVMLQPELIAQESAGRRCPVYGRRTCFALEEEGCRKEEICKWDHGKCDANVERLLLRQEGSAGEDGKESTENGDAKSDTRGTTSDTSETKSDTSETIPETDTPTKQDGQVVPKPDAQKRTENTRSSPEEIMKEACAAQLTRDDFIATLLSSMGEFPGIVISLWVVDLIGRRALMGYGFGITGVLMVILLACVGRKAETAIFFTARGSSTAAFQTAYLYTNEVYPARLRGMAMGVSSSVARVGLIVTPLVAQTLTNVSLPGALWTYFAVSFLAVLVVLVIPIETTGRPLLDTMQELVDLLRGEKVDTEGSFAKDPGVNWFVRFLRWNAKVDGGATAALPG